MTITNEMLKWFCVRTFKHIDLVDKYLQPWESKLPDVDNHDASKLKEPELTPYILISWNYHCKDLGIPFEVDQDTKDLMNLATEHHVRTNRHHPEYWTTRAESLIPKEDRDKFDPSKVPTIYVPNMPKFALIEMCADWCAMSEEKENTPFEWYNKVVGTRWDFGKEKNSFVLDVLKEMWN